MKTLHWPFQRRLAPAGKRRALLRLIAVALEHRLDLAEAVGVWAEESRGRWRLLVGRLARDLQNGVSLPDAFERQPNLLSDEQALLVRFAHESGTLAPTLRRLLDEPNWDSTSPWRTSFGYLVLFVFFALPLGAFIAFKINPQFAQIFWEFGLEPPGWFYFGELFGGPMLVGWLLALIGLLLSRLLRVFDTPGVWFRRRVLGRLSLAARSRRVAEVFRRLADASAAGRPIAGALATLARRHYDPVIRHQLLEARNEVGLGVEPWPALNGAGLLTPSEQAALAAADRLGCRAWTFRALAAVRVERLDARRRLAGAIATGLAIGLLGVFVLMSALSVFTIVTELTNSLS